MPRCSSCHWWTPHGVRDRDPECDAEAVCRYKHPSELAQDQYGYRWTETPTNGTCRHYRRAWIAMARLWVVRRWDWLLGRIDTLWWRWWKYPRLLRKNNADK